MGIMASMQPVTINETQWIVWVVVGIFATFTSAHVAVKERRSRLTERSLFSNDCSRYTSALSIACGLLTALSLCCTVIPLACVGQRTVTPILFHAQFTLMGLYQLSRLNEIGYPPWSLTFMALIGTALWMSCLVLSIAKFFRVSACRFDGGLAFIWEYSHVDLIFHDVDAADIDTYDLWVLLNSVSMLCWNIATMMLFCCKIRSLRHVEGVHKDVSWHRTSFMLHRIVTISVFYLIPSPIVVLPALWGDHLQFGVVDGALIPCSLCTVYTFSMFLMMDHNTDWYYRFLHIARKCCCCHGVIDRQLKQCTDANITMIEMEDRGDKFHLDRARSDSDQDRFGKEFSAETPETYTVQLKEGGCRSPSIPEEHLEYGTIVSE